MHYYTNKIRMLYSPHLQNATSSLLIMAIPLVVWVHMTLHSFGFYFNTTCNTSTAKFSGSSTLVLSMCVTSSSERLMHYFRNIKRLVYWLCKTIYNELVEKNYSAIECLQWWCWKRRKMTWIIFSWMWTRKNII